MAAVVNMNNLLNGKDSRWLQLEVCREFQRNKCSRPDTECKFAHPPANVEVQNGRVTACYDSIKGRCNREKPPCKYFHPPQHLKDQLLINGRNHLALKNALMQQMGIAPGQQGVLPGQVQTVANPYLTGVPANTYNPYFTPAGHIMPTLLGPDPTVASQLGPVVPQAVPVAQQKIPRSDRLEMDVKTVGSFYYDNFAYGMVPYKRPAADKSGIPVYQPNTTYQQLMQLQQPYVPVSCEYLPSPSSSTTSCVSSYIFNNNSATTTNTTNAILSTSNNSLNNNMINQNNNNHSNSNSTNSIMNNSNLGTSNPTFTTSVSIANPFLINANPNTVGAANNHQQLLNSLGSTIANHHHNQHQFHHPHNHPNAITNSHLYPIHPNKNSNTAPTNTPTNSLNVVAGHNAIGLGSDLTTGLPPPPQGVAAAAAAAAAASASIYHNPALLSQLTNSNPSSKLKTINQPPKLFANNNHIISNNNNKPIVFNNLNNNALMTSTTTTTTTTNSCTTSKSNTDLIIMTTSSATASSSPSVVVVPSTTITTTTATSTVLSCSSPPQNPVDHPPAASNTATSNLLLTTVSTETPSTALTHTLLTTTTASPSSATTTTMTPTTTTLTIITSPPIMASNQSPNNNSKTSPTNSVNNYASLDGTDLGLVVNNSVQNVENANDEEKPVSNSDIVRDKLEALCNDSNNNIFTLGNNNPIDSNSSLSDNVEGTNDLISSDLPHKISTVSTALDKPIQSVQMHNHLLASNVSATSALGVAIPSSIPSSLTNQTSHASTLSSATVYPTSTHLLPNPQLYPDPAYLAKEAAQKSYAMKLASLSGKPLTAMGYHPPQLAAANQLQQQQLAALAATKSAIPGLMAQQQPQQNMAQFAAAFAQYQHMQHAAAAANSGASSATPGSAAHLARLPSPYSAQSMNSLIAAQQQAQQVAHSQSQSVAQMYSTMHRPPPPVFVQSPHFLRPQIGATGGAASLTPGHNPYAAAATTGNPQFYSGNIFYPGLAHAGAGYAQQLGMSPAGLSSPITGATAGSAAATAYSTGLHSANFQAIQAVQQAQQASGQGAPTAAVVLNPYKKMKTS